MGGRGDWEIGPIVGLRVAARRAWGMMGAWNEHGSETAGLRVL